MKARIARWQLKKDPPGYRVGLTDPGGGIEPSVSLENWQNVPESSKVMWIKSLVEHGLGIGFETAEAEFTVFERLNQYSAGASDPKDFAGVQDIIRLIILLGHPKLPGGTGDLLAAQVALGVPHLFPVQVDLTDHGMRVKFRNGHIASKNLHHNFMHFLIK
jgi:hypothetical protein